MLRGEGRWRTERVCTGDGPRASGSWVRGVYCGEGRGNRRRFTVLRSKKRQWARTGPDFKRLLIYLHANTNLADYAGIWRGVCCFRTLLLGVL